MMLINYVKAITRLQNKYFYLHNVTRLLTQGCLNLENQELTNQLKQSIESHWKKNLNKFEYFDANSLKPKFYVLSMFPYPSGNLHMGHVRVYSISDTMARFYRMNGKNVLHPMGWDAFGLPAENAAIERNIPANEWTQKNIENMKKQLMDLGSSFDWNREFATCNSNYYKWTQVLFLKLYKEGLAYQKEASVNWDPIDKTVLADEQVDADGCSWRSGAKVEKKILNQWFIKTTKFAKQLYDGLNDPILEDWKDIINLQKHWIGDCNGYSFDLNISYDHDDVTNPDINQQQHKLKTLTVWTKYPEQLEYMEFIILNSQHTLNCNQPNGLHNFTIINPFRENHKIPIFISDEVEFSEHCDTYVGCPSLSESDKVIAKKFGINVIDNASTSQMHSIEETRNRVLTLAKQLNIGGYLVSSKLKDWLISRQRYWGTPIPIIHCTNCGTVPVPENELPIILPTTKIQLNDQPLIKCPNCKSVTGKLETDTMDTFVDSSWYFLRFLDSNNLLKMFDETLAGKLMPVDLYIGGKEHAVLHLYYARFINHFLHSLNLVPHSEPFKRLLVQGMVMGRSFKLKDSGKYLRENEVNIINAKKNKANEKTTGKDVIMQWEKMSKSKLNGVDPIDIINEYGVDTTRLIILADVAPTSHRNWSSATFPGILKWQKRLWLTINDFKQIRNDHTISKDIINTKEFIEQDLKLYDARNYYIKGTTFNYRHSHQLSVAISKMQGLTNSLRRTPKGVIKYGKEYERTLATQIIMLAPIAPHFASELWSHFIQIENRINTDSLDINWNENVLEQNWPEVDAEYELNLEIKVNGADVAFIKFPRSKLDRLTFDEAITAANESDLVQSKLDKQNIERTTFIVYPGCEARLGLFKDQSRPVTAPAQSQLDQL